MYPFLKFSKTMLMARSRPKLALEDPSILQFRVGLSDIDLFMELNNARFFNYMELGRWDYIYRTGVLQVMRKQNWGATVGGSSIRFRRRIPFLSRFTLTSEMICHDGRWFYVKQETYLEDKICSSALMKVGFTSKEGLVPASEALKLFDRPDWGSQMPEWVTAWLEAESMRPWPGNS
jgi:acyl-CoA thioesterase FadM